MKLVICSACHRERPHKARKLCASCYLQWNRKQHLERCKECPQMIHRGTKHGLCRLCCTRMIGARRYGYALDYFDE